jgi:hypothetical protein
MHWRSMGMCESNTAALCKSNRKDSQNGMGTVWARLGKGMVCVNYPENKVFSSRTTHLNVKKL